MTNPTPNRTQSEQDAELCGQFIRAGGARLGLLVARSTYAGRGNTTANASAVEAGKMSMDDFARRAGCSRNKISRYRDTWDAYVEAHRTAAAKDGSDPAQRAHAEILLLADELVPGQEIEFAEMTIEGLPPRLQWSTFYKAAGQVYAPTDETGDGALNPIAEFRKSLKQGSDRVSKVAETFKGLLEPLRQQLGGDETEQFEGLRALMAGAIDSMMDDLTKTRLAVLSDEATADPTIGQETKQRVATIVTTIGKVQSYQRNTIRQQKSNAEFRDLLRQRAAS